MINYYVDPGQGFVFTQNLSFIWSIFWGIAAGMAVFFKFFRRFFLRPFFLAVIIGILLISGGIVMFYDRPAALKKVIVIGIDAFDPGLFEEFSRQGMLPNLSGLAETGAYSRMETTIPSESAVAWTSFATGLRPGEHGIFDFVMRDPDNYGLYLSLNEIKNERGRPRVLRRNKGKFFWEILSAHRIYSEIYFCPNTFPPGRVRGRIISGMGVPDITGTMGRSAFYTSSGTGGGAAGNHCRIIETKISGGGVDTLIFGPSIADGRKLREAAVHLKIDIDYGADTATLRFQGRSLTLRPGAWSDWRRITFKLGLLNNANGIMRFYLKSLSPSFELYATPVNFDPRAPLFPISYPAGFAGELADRNGMFYTQGMPSDTWALTDGILDEKVFLEIIDEIFAERKRILEDRLSDFRQGMFFFYLDTLDNVQHMFWRYRDARGYPPGILAARKDVILEYYRKIDELVGMVMRHADKNTTLMVISDHGFTSFRKSVDLNRWLLDNGYLFLKDAPEGGDGELLCGIDWSRSRAYALGFGGIYLNMTGREYYGIVAPEERRALEEEISGKLRGLKDPLTGDAVVRSVYRGDDVFKGGCRGSSPDLFAGFAPGYRGSWKTALGGVAGALIEENTGKWSGDHLVDPPVVPAVIFVNRKICLKNPSIIDIAPTALDLLGVDIPEEMPGKVLFKDD